ncbi:MAG: hypothetical protein KatS3mg105_4126 [Gemmatales bacterium]|nr:MAG: hypothetical protein KatS3mg105_4126 [Gemmatales bacterium]
MSDLGNNTGDRYQEDPRFLNARREAWMILGLWLVAFVWTVSYCYLFGYLSHPPSANATGGDIARVVGELESFNREPTSLRMYFGIPDWVFWGIAVPWVLCIAASFAFCLLIYREDELGDGADEDEI